MKKGIRQSIIIAAIIVLLGIAAIIVLYVIKKNKEDAQNNQITQNVIQQLPTAVRPVTADNELSQSSDPALRYEQVAEKTTRASGQVFVASPTCRVKIEGAGLVGQRRR